MGDGDECGVMVNNDTQGKAEEVGEKPARVPLHPT
jgi:hypothetical protein